MTTFPVFGLSNLASGIATVTPPVDLRRVADANATAILAAVRRFAVTTMTSKMEAFAGNPAIRRPIPLT